MNLTSHSNKLRLNRRATLHPCYVWSFRVGSVLCQIAVRRPAPTFLVLPGWLMDYCIAVQAHRSSSRLPNGDTRGCLKIPSAGGVAAGAIARRPGWVSDGTLWHPATGSDPRACGWAQFWRYWKTPDALFPASRT